MHHQCITAVKDCSCAYYIVQAIFGKYLICTEDSLQSVFFRLLATSLMSITEKSEIFAHHFTYVMTCYVVFF